MASRTRKTLWTLAALAATGTAGAIGLFVWGAPGAGGPQRDGVVDATARAEVVDRIAAELGAHYVFPDVAASLAQQLRALQAGGAFDRIGSANAFAERLTEALQDGSHDLHLEVRYMPDDVPVAPADGEPTAAVKAIERAQHAHFNFGFAAVRRLQGNIGYIELHQFGRPEPSAPRIQAAMQLVADTGSLIIDLRHCGGGDPETVMRFASYLFEARTHLNDIVWRDEQRTEERWTDPTVPGPRYGSARRIYVLTGHDTFSAGEDFAYALKTTGRATLIGETTGGGAHPGAPRRLTAHFMMNVPTGRTVNPITQTDWERVGVAPDVATSADDALDAAQVAALTDMIAHETDADWKARITRRLDELR